ncbi:MAG: copper amine oxidase [Paenibacillaceae bacterium]|jgi:hypothetical protein|nr:copper amine oxidase [Paenibacillaceae bacterium]
MKNRFAPEDRFKRMARAALVATCLAASFGTGIPAVYAEDFWTLERQARQDEQNGNLQAAAPKWKLLLDHYMAEGNTVNAALYAKNLGKYYDGQKQYETAIYYYELENENWLKAGYDWGAQDLFRAEEIRSTLDLYVQTADESALAAAGAGNGTGLAKFEPVYGTYLGMYSELDPQMGNNYIRSEQFYNKKHAIYLAYTQWGKPFPRQYAVNAKAAGAALQIAFEPMNGLDEVKDGEYIRQWAAAAKATGVPIFLRYASEMNGNWVPWHGDTAKYMEKFKLIHDIMEQEAPNVAMVWSPGDVPINTMAAYYPGDAYVDWVGISMYSTPYENGDSSKQQPGLGPVDRLDEIYRLYADRKPVMISETAVTHTTVTDGKNWTEWGVMNLERLYEVMTKQYPRLKAITYFNRGATQPGVTDNFLLRDNEAMMNAYKRLIGSSHFLSKVENGAKPAAGGGYLKAQGSAAFSGRTVVYPYIKLPDIYNGKVEYRLNGMLLKTEQPPYKGVELEPGGIVPGSVLEVKAFNQAGISAVTRQLVLEPRTSVTVNGRSISFEQTPVNWQGNVLVPMRAVFEALGAQVSWNQTTRTATGQKGSTTASVTIDSFTAVQNGKEYRLEAAPRLINSTTMVPVRFIAESFGAKVEWDGANAAVRITMP